MKRELKGPGCTGTPLRVPASFKTDPDEKGTESVEQDMSASQYDLGFKTDPDEKGTERAISQSAAPGLTLCFKTDPDEKGTERDIV